MDEHQSVAGTTDTPPPQAPPYRRVFRRADRAVIGGVAAGLGEYFAVDPLVFRVGFVIAALAGGVGIFAYLLLWFLVPVAGEEGSPGVDRMMSSLRGLPTWLGVALLILGAAAVARGLGISHPAIFWGVALIGLGTLLFFQGREHPQHVRQRATVPLAGGVGSGGLRERLGRLRDPDPRSGIARPEPGSGFTGVPLSPPGTMAWTKRPIRRRRERSALGWITFGAVLLAIGIAALLDSTGVATMTLGRYFALTLAVLGVGVLVGARWGRARWLIVPGILLLPLVLASSLIDVPLVGGVGQRSFRPAALADVRPVYRLAAGNLILDLRAVQFTSGSITVTATVAAGQVRVLVPRNVSVVAHGSAGAGAVDLFGVSSEGLRVSVDRTFVAQGETKRLVLDLEVGMGRVSLVGEPLANLG
jgi:phage shock protein PspC (stress-responsive transcriptional regulator)/FtsH-binding integral membrane protein